MKSTTVVSLTKIAQMLTSRIGRKPLLLALAAIMACLQTATAMKGQRAHPAQQNANSAPPAYGRGPASDPDDAPPLKLDPTNVSNAAHAGNVSADSALGNAKQQEINAQLANLLEKMEGLKGESREEEKKILQKEINEKMAEWENAGKPEPERKPKWWNRPLARTVAGITGVAGLPSTYFIAGSVKTDADWSNMTNGNISTTQNIGFSAADVKQMTALENAEHAGKADVTLTHDLHDVMFAEDLNELRQVGLAGEGVEGTHFEATGAFKAEALLTSITVYLIVGILCALVAIGFLFWAAGPKNGGARAFAGVAGAGVIAGGSMAIGGYHMWLNNYAANTEAPDMAFSDQGVIIAGIVLAATGMLAFLCYLGYQSLRALFCPKEEGPLIPNRI